MKTAKLVLAVMQVNKSYVVNDTGARVENPYFGFVMEKLLTLKKSRIYKRFLRPLIALVDKSCHKALMFDIENLEDRCNSD